MPNLERLWHTVQELEKRQDREFNLGVWGYEDSGTSCGTVACAFGSEAYSKYGQENGLTIVLHPSGIRNSIIPVYQGLSDFSAAAAYYDIPRSEAVRLFSPDEYVRGKYTSKEVVIERIKDYICKNKPAE